MKYFAILDVESVGLYGKSFSYGIVLGGAQENILKEIYRYSEKNKLDGCENAIPSDQNNGIQAPSF